jgi:hypothetical protein
MFVKEGEYWFFLCVLTGDWPQRSKGIRPQRMQRNITTNEYEFSYIFATKAKNRGQMAEAGEQ